MNRRIFIRLSAATVAALSVPVINGCKEPNENISIPVFLSQALDKKTLNEIGRGYLELKPEENGIDKLEDHLLEKSPITDSSDKSSIESFFTNKIKDDFTQGKTVIVKGWVLSLTEARQCALFSLTQN